MRTHPINWSRIDLPADARINEGYGSLAQEIVAAAGSGEARRVVVDGMWGAQWNRWSAALEQAAAERGIRLRILSTLRALRSPDALIEHFSYWLTDNPTFGRVCERPVWDYFEPKAFDQLVREFLAAAPGVDLQVLMGPGALSDATRHADVKVYCDVPREIIVNRQNSENLGNFGFGEHVPGHGPQKVAMYVEWPLLERHKRNIWNSIDVYASDCDGLAWIKRNGLDRLIADVSRRPFRCKPYFMPGVWGGHRLQEVAGIGEDWVNCAWDFEIIAPENAITIGHDQKTITVPFHTMMWLCAQDIVGPYVYRLFGEDFPIRFNYLDTMGGSNLSLQVHPHTGYIREHFGERMPQDETYYVVENKPGAKVFLGLRSGVTREAFTEVIRRAEQEGVPFDISQYAKAWPSEKGALYVIPSGTLHCSGANNLVLEISATTYWYTFKLYDYLRPDLSGKPRPINAQYGLDVLDMSRTEDWVGRALIPEPMVVREEEGGTELHLGTNPQMFFSVNRLDVRTEMQDDTDGRFHVLALVDGKQARLRSVQDPSFTVDVQYLETFVVPASFGAYTVEAVGEPCQVIKAFVKR